LAKQLEGFGEISMNDYSQKHLLFALLACQNELITKPQLVAAFSVWLSDRSKGLDLILVDQGSLSELQRSVLDSLVDLHLAKHGDLQKSLAQLSSMDGIAQELHSLALPDVAATLPPVFSEYATSLHLPNSSKNPASSKISNADDRFRIIRHHANGGLGVVHVAEDQQLRRQVALKQIRADCADYDSYRTKFVQEAEITGQLEHPGIVPVYGLGTDAAGRPYYAMRFIKGEELKTRIQSFHAGRKNKSQSLDTPELRNLLRRFTDICDAIDYAHDRGVLHRDLKPGNVMLGKHGETLVVDWGLAKPMKQAPEADPWSTVRPSFELPIQPSGSNDNSATAYGSFLGTPAYAPPEQISGELDKLCPQSDVYSLGAILYEILAGRPPVEKANSQAMLLSIHTNNKIPAPRSLDASIPKPLNAICQKAISFNIVDRYTSAAELKTEIERWLDDSPVQAFPDPLLQRTRRWLRKHPRSVAAVATMALVGITSAVTISAIVGQKNQQLAQANSDLTEANASRLAATVALLEQAPAEAVPTLLQGMESVREKILPTLESHWALGGLPNSQRVRLALALLPSDESVDDFLKSQLLAVPPADSIMIRNALKSRGQELTPSLWRITEAADTLPEKRLRAAAALAEFDPQSPRWNEVARPTVAAMLAANPLDWGTWIDGLRPVREYLIPALAERFRDHTAVEQCYGAASVCAEYAADRPEILADLAADSDPRQFSVLFSR